MSGEMEKIRKKLDGFEEEMTRARHFWWTEIFRISFLNREYYYKGRLNLVPCVTNVRLNLSADNFNSMKQTRKPGRPREWVLNEETIEIKGNRVSSLEKVEENSAIQFRCSGDISTCLFSGQLAKSMKKMLLVRGRQSQEKVLK